MMASQSHPACPVNGVHDDHLYALRKFAGGHHLSLSNSEQMKPEVAQLQLGTCEPSGNGTVPTIEGRSTHRSLIPRVWPYPGLIDVPSRSESETQWVKSTYVLQSTEDAPSPFKNACGSDESWQSLNSGGLCSQFNNPAHYGGNHAQYAISADVGNQPLAPSFFGDCPPGNERSCLVVSNELSDRIPPPFQGQMPPDGEVALPRFQDWDSSSSGSHVTMVLTNPVQSTVCNSISPVSPTESGYSEHSHRESQPISPTKPSCHFYNGISQPGPATSVGALDSACGIALFPAAATGDWYAPDYPYQCSPDVSFSTVAASNCGTPDTSFGFQDSMAVSDTTSQQYMQADPDASQCWVGQALPRSVSEPTTVFPARVVSSDNHGAKRIAGKIPSHRSECKDVFLVNCKRNGMSYKEIKEKGQFAEAESTLRGRYRMLTKRKEHRVRKPGWHEYDVKLLCEAVQKFADTSRHSGSDEMKVPKISWKQIAEYIWHNGGSYHFGNATCKKKWDEIRRQPSHVATGA